jgi:hypothetical protein
MFVKLKRIKIFGFRHTHEEEQNERQTSQYKSQRIRNTGTLEDQRKAEKTNRNNILGKDN